MRILVTGYAGYVGRMVCDYFRKEHEVFGADLHCEVSEHHYRCDLRNEKEVKTLSSAIRPDVVIHAAGQKEILFCENNGDEAFGINSLTTENVAKAFGDKSRVLYISTDYVFDGKTGHYTEDDLPYPSTVYGKSKYSAEREGRRIAGDNFFVVRTAALYSSKAKFIEYLVRNMSRGQTVSCYEDTYYSPTYSLDLLQGLEALMQNGSASRRCYHLSGSRVSRYEFALLLAEAFGYDRSLVLPSLRSPEHWYLFPDLSLDSSATQSLLKFGHTTHSTALRNLAAEKGQP